MRFLSNFGCKIIFMRSVNFCYQQDSNSLFKRKHWSRDLLVQVAYLASYTQGWISENDCTRIINCAYYRLPTSRYCVLQKSLIV